MLCARASEGRERGERTVKGDLLEIGHPELVGEVIDALGAGDRGVLPL